MDNPGHYDEYPELTHLDKLLEQHRARKPLSKPGVMVPTEVAINALKNEGLEIWSDDPKDDMPIMITFGTFRRILAASK